MFPNLFARLRGLTLRSKILLMILPASLVSTALAALVGYVTARDALTAQAAAQVTAIRASKKAQVEAYFRDLRDTFAVFSEDVGVAAATQLLTDGFNQLGRQKLAPERRRALEAWYREKYLPDLTKTPGFEQATAEALMPRSDRALEAHALYIAENPHPKDERDKLVDHPAANPYTLAHYTYHPWLREVKERLGLDDLMIVAESGNVVYTVVKEVDLATNLVDGPFAATNLGRLFRRVLAEHRKGYVKLADFEFYAPSHGEPAMFVATPIYTSFKLAGVLVGQISIRDLSRTMNGANSWQADGLGATGFGYIAAADQLLRNDHRAFVERPEEFFKRAAALGYRAEELEAMRRQGTSVLRYRMSLEAPRRALAGESGVLTAATSLGDDALQAYAPLEIPDLDWALGVQIDEDEILAPLARLERITLLVAGLLVLACTFLGMWLAGRFARPIDALMRGIDAVRSGGRAVRVEKTADDEFGRLTDSFNAMSSAVKERDDVIAEKNRAYAGLLHRLFPEAVAERMRSGEPRIVDTFPNVTLVYASIDGFARVVDDAPGAAGLDLLNELIDSFDALADRMGVDRVKTIAEDYVAGCGLAVPRLDHAARAVAFAEALSLEVRRVAAERGVALGVRACVASGRVHAGLVGSHRFAYEVWGAPLDVVRRLIHATDADEIRVTEDVFRQLPPDNGFCERPPVATTTQGVIGSRGKPAPR